MKYETKWVVLSGYEHKTKTSVFGVLSKFDGTELGIIKWHPPWRHYVFFPTTKIETVLSDRCLKDIAQFVTDCNKDHLTGEDMKW